MPKILYPKKNITGKINVPGDKSISHRAIMIGSISEGITEIDGFLKGKDCISTINCFKNLGIIIEEYKNKIIVYGKGIYGLKRPQDILNVENSGTTIRLISGILAAQKFSCEISGDSSILKRPMERIIKPLLKMGAEIYSENGLAPLKIKGANLTGIEYEMPIASAQVKSAILLASLYAKGKTTIFEKEPTRNHSEIMLNYFGANIIVQGNKITCNPIERLIGKKIYVSGDFSSAAFFITATLILPNSSILIENVGVNKTRIGFLKTIIKMGGNIKILNKRNINGEDVADISVKSSKLKGTEVSGEIVPTMIDEIPLFALLATLAKGESIVKNATELKVKESNRIHSVKEELNKLGAGIRETDDGMIIKGSRRLRGSICNSHNDHRIAMCISIASLVCDGNTVLNNPECVDISFPNFFEILENL